MLNKKVLLSSAMDGEAIKIILQQMGEVGAEQYRRAEQQDGRIQNCLSMPSPLRAVTRRPLLPYRIVKLLADIKCM